MPPAGVRPGRVHDVRRVLASLGHRRRSGLWRPSSLCWRSPTRSSNRATCWARSVDLPVLGRPLHRAAGLRGPQLWPGRCRRHQCLDARRHGAGRGDCLRRRRAARRVVDPGGRHRRWASPSAAASTGRSTHVSMHSSSRRRRRDSEQRYRNLFEHAGEAIVVVDAAGTIVEANEAAAALLKTHAGNLPGRAVDSVLGRRSRT